MARLPDAVESGVRGEAAALFEKLIAKRGRIDGMYTTLLNHPQLAGMIGDLGTFFRFGDSVLDDETREFVILYVASRLRIAYEWVKHKGPARDAGISEDIIEALRQGGRDPLDNLQIDLVSIADCALSLQNIPQQLQDRVVRHVGMHGMLELVALVGFYRLIGGIITCFDVPLPHGESDPFSETSGDMIHESC
ncbi:carboxymuconolactone decarboxylase family protein [Desulfovibrio inopinatus]|uniref:carboxymuconolactone decarboxylase family protein n=1 Tax=Desulfovibrio inopinatus TaxID=102109 RepID=UPI00041B8FAB|nr:carboxymuconolactone decarboxylase family protein [Desulfovibrio inopinatus]